MSGLYAVPLAWLKSMRPQCVSTIECANGKCSRAADQPSRVVYIKYDQVNLRYVYCCKHCKHVWRTA